MTAPLEHVGIDPGLRGGVVLLDGSLRARAWWRTPIIEGDGAKAQYDERGLSAIVQGIAVDAVRRGV